MMTKPSHVAFMAYEKAFSMLLFWIVLFMIINLRCLND